MVEDLLLVDVRGKQGKIERSWESVKKKEREREEAGRGPAWIFEGSRKDQAADVSLPPVGEFLDECRRYELCWLSY